MTSVPFILQYLKELNQTQQEQKGDSNMPYPSDTIVRIRKPPPSVFTEPPHGAVNDTHLKKILFWNDDHFSKHFGFGFGRDPFLLAGCRVNNCTTTGDRTRYPLEQIDALIWHFRSKDRSLPKKRSPHTRYVFWMQESPSYLYGNLRNYRNVFNWTFTYRRDSDIVNPYALVFRRRKPLPPDHRDYAAGKTKLAAWFVSHCGTESGRESLVMSLKKRLSVDVYGYCGPLKCDKKNTGDCYNMLNKTYKFYFSFENSLCQEYITEKFFNILK
ncbi:Alpha-(1,3)-fucosyltransferase C [Chionoecetes opilio]|uniref:Fucosyltransferase n=1 Tax=Chionoecetes opilio TaxID=41210 RepID=A0A8J4YIM5_CHIOP|nr:Alpha-(1,3)-fucosyltransferase C [Chionoecetes opilio]